MLCAVYLWQGRTGRHQDTVHVQVQGQGIKIALALMIPDADQGHFVVEGNGLLRNGGAEPVRGDIVFAGCV